MTALETVANNSLKPYPDASMRENVEVSALGVGASGRGLVSPSGVSEHSRPSAPWGVDESSAPARDSGVPAVSAAAEIAPKCGEWQKPAK